ETRALVGENGAGKSTFVKILSGVYQPDEGQIFLNDQQVNFFNPKAAIQAGISVIYQELDLIPMLNCVQNIFLGFEIRNNFFKTVNYKKMKETTLSYLEKMQASIDIDKPVCYLPIAHQQIVAICKALVHNSKVLFMDEPSASLSRNELENLFKLIRNLKEQNITIIYISHRLEEIFEIADSVTVLRDGELISTDQIKNISKSEIIEKMIGKKITEERINNLEIKDSRIILEVKNLNYKTILKDINFSVKKGEIFGVLGLVGSGRLELARVLSGVYKFNSGEILIKGKHVHLNSPNSAIRNSISYVPDERRAQGLFFNLNLLMNSTMMVIPDVTSKLDIVNKLTMKSTFEKFKKILNIKCRDEKQLVSELSGGNQQKIVFSKCLAKDTDIIILNEPTKGIDVGSKYEIYNFLIDLIKHGKTIIIFSPEIPELCNICNRLMILKRGQVSGIITDSEINQQNVFKALLSN
ncbi:MAG: sugar ABC transporter ATP-binding protein, partial [Actinobacteria bacterium]|nr:sugar ABC transporter ATP-binding protein [Actinomycetota bacterium]